MIEIKSAGELKIMAEAGAVTARILEDLGSFIRPGLSTKDVDDFVEGIILDQGMEPAFKGYGGFPASACVSVNEEVIHGIPSSERVLMEGDIVSVDLGTLWQGYYSDAARTYGVGRISPEKQRLIRIAEESFFKGLEQCLAGRRLGDVSHAIQSRVEEAGFSVIRDFVGHGIGRQLHEEPMVPNYGPPHRGVKLRPGMVLAIEPMIAAGHYEVDVLADNWTAVTLDGSAAAHYEHTVVITDGKPELLTALPSMSPAERGECSDQRRNGVHG